MKLHKIHFSHYSPKDSEQGVKTYVLADSEIAIRDRIDATFKHGAWKDAEGDGPIDIYNDDFEVIGQEGRLERALRLRGDIDDENNDYADAYYGLTFWGWDEGQDITEDLASELIRLGIAEDWRTPQPA